MEKPAPTDIPVHDLIKNRWSPRAFGDRSLSPQTLRSLLEAARWSPSAFNDQPWHFIIALKEQSAQFTRLLDCLVEANRLWAQHAAGLAIAVARTNFSRKDAPNPHAYYDTGQAVAALTVQATALGLRIHQMAGFVAQKARDAYAIPEGYDPVAVLALGYPGDPDSLPDKLRSAEVAERIRKPLEECVFGEGWGTPPAFPLEPGPAS